VNQGGGIHPGQAPTAHHVQQPAHQQTPPQPSIPQVVQPPQVGQGGVHIINRNNVFHSFPDREITCLPCFFVYYCQHAKLNIS
jgi:hypothetical protein